VKHMVNRFGKMKNSASLVVHIKFVPEKDLLSIAAPVPFHENRIPCQWIGRPFFDQGALPVEPMDLRPKIGFARTPVSVKTGSHHCLRLRKAVERMSRFYLLSMFGGILPQDFCRRKVQRQRSGVAEYADRFCGSISVEIGKRVAVGMVVV